jgi:penicillin-binding protein 2
MSEKNNNIFVSNSNSSIDSSLEGRYKKTWTEESFYFENKTNRQVITPHSTTHVGTSFTDKKKSLFFIFLIIIFTLIAGRLFYLQIIKGADYYNFAEGNRQRIIPIVAERGLIYDRNNVQLTKNIPNFSLALIPQDLPRDQKNRDLIIKKLAYLTNQKEKDIRSTLDEYGSYSYESIVIEEDIDYDTALSILIASTDLPGIQIQRSSKRLYLTDIGETKSFSTSTPNSFSHILGYIGKLDKEELKNLYNRGYLPSDNIGKTGVERTYEDFLRGTYGRRRIEVNAAGKEQSTIAQEEPKPGFHIKLTIDAEIQKNLENTIQKNLDAAEKSRASGIVMDPQTGEILALVSLPSFDNNDFSGGIDYSTYQKYIENENNPLFNRSLSGTYPSGSTIKMGVAAAALQEGMINSASSFLSMGGLQVGPWFFPDWQAGGHGQTNVRKSIAWSVNTFYYYIGGGYNDFVGLGVAKITEYLSQFGFAKKTGIDLPGEQVGFLPSKEWKQDKKNERWYVGDTYNLSIGQGDILVTPIQLANYTTALANKGILYKPHLVKSIIDPINKEEQIVDSEIINKDFINKSHINTVRLGMKDCVDYGSCRRLSLLPFSAAGKTGTAQWNKSKNDHAWFTAFAPFENPKIVVTILVEEGGGGSEMAAPIAYEFLRWWGIYTKQ